VVTDFGRYVFYPREGEWEIYLPRPGGGYGVHSGGIKGLHARYLDASDNLLTRGLYLHQCSTRATACITIHLPVREMLALEGGWLVLIPLRALVVAGLVFFLVHYWLMRRGTERGRIKVALRRRAGFSCLYQPIVDISTGEPLGCEVLARFEDEFGLMTPDVFVPIVEGLDGTWGFTTIILEMAFRDLAPLLAARPDFGVSVNFYPRDLTAARIPRLAACPTLEEVAQRGYKLHFEVIETAFGDLDSLSETIDHLHSRGFLISIDDFGTGSANLEQVQRLRADFVKIDRSFMRGLEPSSTSIRASLVPQIVDIARKVDVSLIAEGIETPEQVQILKKLGVHLGQGYYFARPMRIDALEQYVKAAEADLSSDEPSALPSIA
jgi:sensor c-di-GMP phosphodiesterase-like protein